MFEEIEKEVPQDDSASHGERMLFYWFIRELKSEIVVETGTHRGLTTLFMAQALKDNDKGHLYTTDPVDWGAPGNFRKFPELEKLISYKKIKGKGLDVRDIDFLFIDSFHEKEVVLEEIDHYFPRLRKNAVVIFHDAAGDNEFVGVNGAVKERKLKTIWVPTSSCIRIYAKD